MPFLKSPPLTPFAGSRKAQSLGLFALAGCAVLSGCPADSEEVRPPAEQFFFPTGVALSPDENSLFVINANSDLRYDSGTVTRVDLAAVKELASEWLASGELPDGRDCEVDNAFANTMICNEAEILSSEQTVRTGNFGTELSIQELADGTHRIFSATRGDPSVTWIDFDPATNTLECGGSGGAPRCDNEHRLNRLRNDESIGRISSEPFGIHADSTGEFVIVSHLLNGIISLIDAPADGSPPTLSDRYIGAFAPSPVLGQAVAMGIDVREPGGRVYVTSRSENRVQMLTVGRVGTQLPILVENEHFFLNGVIPSDNGRGIRFSADGNRAYIVNRSPATLQVIDTSLDDVGQVRNQLLEPIEICANAANLEVGDLGDGERVFVSCFREGQIWVANPQAGIVESIIDVGRGPQDLALSPANAQLYVSNFLEDTVAVVDVERGSPTQNRVVLKLGRTRQSGGN